MLSKENVNSLFDLLNHVREGVLILEDNFNITYLNQAAQVLLGLQPHEKFIHQNLEAILPKDHRFLMYLRRMKNEKIAYLSEKISCSLSPMKLTECKLTLIQLHNGEGESRGYQVVIEDLSEEKELNHRKSD